MSVIARERQLQLQTALIVSFVSQGFVASAIIPRVPDIISQLNVSFATWGLVSGLTAVGAALGLSSANPFIQRWGGKRVALFSFVFVILAQASLGFLTDVMAYFLVSLCISFSMSVYNIAINSQAVVLQTVTGRVILGRFHASWSIGTAVSVTLSGLVAPFLPLWLHLLVFALTGGLVWILFGTRLLDREEGFTADQASSEKAEKWRHMPKRVWLLGIGLAVGVFPEAAMWDWSNVYGREYLGYDLGRAAIPYSVFAFSMIVGRLTIDTVGKRIPLYIQGAVGATVGAIALSASTLFGPAITADKSATGLIAISALWALAGLGAAPVTPSFLSSATLVSGMSTAHALARISILQMASIIVMKFAMGNVAEQAGVGIAYWIPVCSWIAAVCVALWAYGLHRKQMAATD